MTNEQRKAIEICKEKIIEPFYDFPNPISIELKDTDVGAIETILSLIKKHEEEMKKKDKQIDLMVEWIEKHTKYYDEDGCYCEVEKEICKYDIECKDCIKQYFERKVEDEKKERCKMPNWCKGTLKVRGKKENIIKFIKDGTSLLDGLWEPKEIVPEVKINDCDEIEIENIDKTKGIDYLYIKGTRRHFIDPIENEIYIHDIDEEEQIICLKNFRAAWGIDADALRVISTRYDIDFKIYAFECGMEFNQDIEIVKGKIIKNEEITFDNYYWECIEPEIGG